MRSFLRSERRATGAEYALLLALLASGVALAVMGLGDKMSGAMGRASALLAEVGMKPPAVMASAGAGAGASAKGSSTGTSHGKGGHGKGAGGGSGKNPSKGQ
jgi:Flp pilus assembly pilin Flp